MKGYLVILLLSATCLVQQCAARSVPRSIQYSDRDELYTHVLGDYVDFIKGTLRQSKNYLERTQTEIDGMTRPSGDMNTLNRKIGVLLTDINEVLEKPKASGDEAATNFLQMVLCFAKAMIFPIEFVVDEDAMEILDRNGLTKFFEDFQSDAGTFLDKFDAAINIYLENLSEAKKIKEHDMIEWYNEFKSSPHDVKIRFQKASQFFQKFRPSENFHI